MALRTSSSPKIALVYDRVNTPFGGAERVLLALHEAFPQAPLYTAIANHQAHQWASVFEVRTSWLQHIPFASYLHRLLAPLMPLAFETLDLSEFDVIISVTSAEAKGVVTSAQQLHLCYLLSPPRYLYHQRQELVQAAWWSKVPGLSAIGSLALRYLTWWDQTAMHRPDKVFPLSQTVANRYQHIYHRTPEPILYPPTQTQHSAPRLTTATLSQFWQKNPHFLLMVARLVPYKRVDLAIQAAKTAELPLVIVGDGPDAALLRSQLTDKILLLPKITEAELSWLYQHCQLVVLPGVEDFGLTALEANSHGKPVIINSQAGAAEVITDGLHGIHFQKMTQKSLVEAIRNCQSHVFSARVLRQNALKYDTSIFVNSFQKIVKTEWNRHQQGIIQKVR